MEKPTVTVTDQPPPYSAAMPEAPPQSYPAPGGAQYPPPPPPGYTPYGGGAGAGAAPLNTAYLHNYGAGTAIIPLVIAVRACPACRVGILKENFTCLGILCAIIFFPFGFLCCYALRKRRCTNCGATFGLD